MGLGLLLLSLALLGACQDSLVFSAYQTLPHARWDSRDTLTFVVPPSADGQEQALTLSVRVEEVFRYRQVVLRVEQVRDGRVLCADTASVVVFGAEDQRLGHGWLVTHNNSRVLPLRRRPGVADTLRVTHVMRAGTLQGIPQVGVLVERR